jgi:cytochrome P450
MQQSLPLLAERFPRLELADEPAQRGTFVLRGYDAVPVSVTF